MIDLYYCYVFSFVKQGASGRAWLGIALVIYLAGIIHISIILLGFAAAKPLCHAKNIYVVDCDTVILDRPLP